MTSPTKARANRRRGIVIVAFAVYVALLAWVVLWKLDVPWIGEAAGLARPIKLVPFVAAGDDGASKPNEMLINLVLFVPFGLFAGALAPAWAWWKTGLAALGASLVLETVQHLISTGSFDTTDLIVNTAGALIGWSVFVAVRRAAGERTSVVMSRVCAVVAVLLLVAVIAFVASPLKYGPQRDVLVGRSKSMQSTAPCARLVRVRRNDALLLPPLLVRGDALRHGQWRHQLGAPVEDDDSRGRAHDREVCRPGIVPWSGRQLRHRQPVQPALIPP